MTSTWVPWLVALGLLLFGGFFLVTGVRTARTDALRRRTWRSYPGQVVASRLDGEQTRCEVEYRRADGTVVRFWNAFTSTVVRDPVGRGVQVLENPADPRDAVVGSGLVGGDLVGTVFAVVGGLLVAAGVAVGVVTGLVQSR